MNEKEQSFVRRATNELFIAKDGAKIFELLRPENSGIKNMSIASGILEPGQKALLHYHKISEEAYYIIHGKGKVRVDNNIEDIKMGDTIHIPVFSLHALENTSSKDTMEILAISSPPYSDDDIYFIE